MSIWQLCWQNKEGTVVPRIQRDVNSAEEMRVFVKDAWKECPPPKGSQFLMYNENSKYFSLMELSHENSRI